MVGYIYWFATNLENTGEINRNYKYENNMFFTFHINGFSVK